eukprot:2681_1
MAHFTENKMSAYITNYLYAILSLIVALYLLKSRRFQFKLRDRYYSSGVYFISVAIFNITIGMALQLQHYYLIYWILWSIAMIIQSIATFFFYVLVGPICELYACLCCKCSEVTSYVLYIGIPFILMCINLIYNFTSWQSKLNVIILLIGVVYLIIYTLVDGLQYDCKYASIIWLYMLFAIIMIISGLYTQYMDNNFFGDTFDNDAIWNISQTIAHFVLFGAILYEDKKKLGNLSAPNSPKVQDNSVEHDIDFHIESTKDMDSVWSAQNYITHI